MLRFPTPSFAVSILALVIALGGAGYSATGGTFLLGRPNNASTQTRLIAPVNGATLRVDNGNAGPNAVGISIATNAARPPLAVTSSARVNNLNADLLDGIDSSALTKATTVSFTLAAGALSAPIALPAGRPVLVMGATISKDDRSVGQATLLRVADTFVVWTGLESTSGSTITQGFSSAAGSHIVFIDFAHAVDIEVNDANTIRIHNEASGVREGTVTLIF